MRLEERISHAKQSSDLTYRSITRPNKHHDSDVLAALGAADAVVLAATTAAGESGAVYVRDLIKRLQGYISSQHRGISGYGVACQIVSEIILERCQHETENYRCVNGSFVSNQEWQGEPAGGWQDCPVCLGSGRAAVDRARRAFIAGRSDYDSTVEAVYRNAADWVARRMMDEGHQVWRLLK